MFVFNHKQTQVGTLAPSVVLATIFTQKILGIVGGSTYVIKLVGPSKQLIVAIIRYKIL